MQNLLKSEVQSDQYQTFTTDLLDFLFYLFTITLFRFLLILILIKLK